MLTSWQIRFLKSTFKQFSLLMAGFRLFVQNLKKNSTSTSSNFINKKKWVQGKFKWQEGYGAFSYGHSQLDTIIRYIQNQETHHRRRSFRDEYLAWLKKYEIAFEEKYVFDFLE